MVSGIAIYCGHTVKRFQVLLFIVGTQLNGFKYNCLLLAHSLMVSSIAFYCGHTFKRFQALQFIVGTQSNRFKYCYLLLAHC